MPPHSALGVHPFFAPQASQDQGAGSNLLSAQSTGSNLQPPAAKQVLTMSEKQGKQPCTSTRLSLMHAGSLTVCKPTMFDSTSGSTTELLTESVNQKAEDGRWATLHAVCADIRSRVSGMAAALFTGASMDKLDQILAILLKRKQSPYWAMVMCSRLLCS